VGVVAEGAYGGEFYPVGGGVAGTVITKPNSPDFLKVGSNPFMSVRAASWRAQMSRVGGRAASE
jgi:hypothetical protein